MIADHRDIITCANPLRRRYVSGAYDDILLRQVLSICRTDSAASWVIDKFSNPDQADGEQAVVVSAIFTTMY